MNLRKQLRELIGSVLIAALLGGSLALTLSNAMGMAPDLLRVIIPCAATSLICMLMTLGIWPLLITLLALLGAGVASVYFRLPVYQDLRALLEAMLTDGAITDYSVVMTGLLGVLLTATGFLMTRIHGGVYPALAMLLLVALGSWLFGGTLDIYCIAPAIVAVSMLFASSSREKASFNSAIPIAAVSVAVALLLVPYMGGVADPLQQFGQKVRNVICDYMMFNDARTLYSVQSDGYQAQSGYLGGDANPSDFPIMEVTADEQLLLRGTIKREYTGHIWVDNSINNRYLFISPLRHSLRNSVFGLDMPAAEIPSELTSDVSVSVTYLSRGTSALFVPYRISHLTTGADMVTYYNSTGEVFITRTVRAGDSYSFTAEIPDTYAAGMDAFLTACAAGAAGDEPVSADYLALPDGIEDGVYTLTQSIVSGQTTAYEKAMAIQNYLQTNYYYTLAPGAVDASRDFVSAFLLDGRRGYCTYFASAMGVMARIAGLPSRYVEGYMVVPDESGVTEVTGESAHAWVEIYFDGFGWLSFDPTPDSEHQGDNVQNPDGQNDNPSPEPTPEPTQEPTEQPTSELPPDQTPEPSVNPDRDTQEQPTEIPTQQPVPDAVDDDNNTPPTLLIVLLALLLLIILAALFILIRLHISTPRYALGKTRAAEDGLMIYYRAVLTVLEMQGQVPQSGESPAAFAARLLADNLVTPTFGTFADAVMKARYASMPVTSEMCALGHAAYTEAVKAMSFTEKLRWYRRRIRHGMGNVHQIP